MQTTVIVGTQWGDEGKGKITDYLREHVDYVVRFHGGNNAGHTVVAEGKTYKLHLLPSGVISPHIINIIGNGVVIDPQVLLQEINGLEQQGIHPQLLVSERAHVILPYHIAMDEAISGHQANLAAGSTKRGIAPVYADKMYRHGIRMGDLVEPKLLKEKLEKAYEFNINILAHVFNIPFERTLETIYHEYIGYGEKLKQYLCDTEYELYKAYQFGQRILFEGAQGMSLDPDHGMYPHGTSSNNVAGYCEVGAGLGVNEKKRVVGIVKAYVSRVGKSPFPTELTDATGDKLRDIGHEYGTTTGRSRRIGWLDLVQVRQSVRLSGITEIVLTKTDVLSGFDIIRVCVGYKYNGRIITEMPASLTIMREVTPLYKNVPGWILDEETKKAMSNDGYIATPKALKDYIELIEREVNCPVSIISFGPDRDETTKR